MKVVVTSRAYRQRKKFPKRLKKITLALIQQLADDPFPSHSKKLINYNGYRLRYGDYRIIYQVKKKQVIILAIAHRKDIYRFLK